MLDWMSEGLALALIGCAGGAILGLAARLGRFCTLGAIEDFLYQESSLRLRMWGLAIGLAIMMTYAAAGAGWVTIDQTFYYAEAWSPVTAIVGGLLFGYGMALAGNCGFGALARFGGGDFRAFVIVIVMGLSAYAALSGPLAPLRLILVEATQAPRSVQGFEQLIGLWAGLIGVAIAAFALWNKAFLQSRRFLFASAAVAVAITSGWIGTTYVARAGFEPTMVMSHTYSAPLGEAMIYLMTASGGGLSFGVGSVFGVLLGAFAGSLIKGHFRWEACEDPRELRRQILGAVAMGFGAVLAMGCTIGQGISAFSVLSFSAPLVFVSIFIGAALGLRQLIAGFSLYPAE